MENILGSKTGKIVLVQGNETQPDTTKLGDKDHYAVLGVLPTASPDEIKSAYRKVSRQYHPDMNTDPSAVANFQIISEAYSTLSDDKKRSKYDWEMQKKEFADLHTLPEWLTSMNFLLESVGKHYADELSENFIQIIQQNLDYFREKFEKFEKYLSENESQKGRYHNQFILQQDARLLEIFLLLRENGIGLGTGIFDLVALSADQSLVDRFSFIDPVYYASVIDKLQALGVESQQGEKLEKVLEMTQAITSGDTEYINKHLPVNKSQEKNADEKRAFYNSSDYEFYSQITSIRYDGKSIFGLTTDLGTIRLLREKGYELDYLDQTIENTPATKKNLELITELYLCKGNPTSIIKLLLQTPDSDNQMWEALMSIAALQVDSRSVISLVQAINKISDENGLFLIHRTRDFDKISSYAKLGVDCNLVTRDKKGLLHIIIEEYYEFLANNNTQSAEAHKQLLQQLLLIPQYNRRAFDPNLVSSPRKPMTNLASLHDWYVTPISLAQDTEIAQLLLENTSKIEYKFDRGSTAKTAFNVLENMKLAEFYIDYIQKSMRPEESKKLLTRAFAHKVANENSEASRQVTLLLARAGADVNIVDYYHPRHPTFFKIFSATSKRDLYESEYELLMMIINGMSDVDKSDRSKPKTIWHALMESPMSFLQRDKDGNETKIMAERKIKIANELRKKMADVNVDAQEIYPKKAKRYTINFTPLHSAIFSGCETNVEVAIGLGCNAETRKCGQSSTRSKEMSDVPPLYFAVQHQPKCIRILLEQLKGNVSVIQDSGYNGWSAIYEAILLGDLESVIEIAKYGGGDYTLSESRIDQREYCGERSICEVIFTTKEGERTFGFGKFKQVLLRGQNLGIFTEKEVLHFMPNEAIRGEKSATENPTGEKLQHLTNPNSGIIPKADESDSRLLQFDERFLRLARIIKSVNDKVLLLDPAHLTFPNNYNRDNEIIISGLFWQELATAKKQSNVFTKDFEQKKR